MFCLVQTARCNPAVVKKYTHRKTGGTTKGFDNKKYNKAKMTAYRKAKQPITDGTGENSGTGVDIKLESIIERKQEILSEEFSKIQNLINYDRKTQ